MESSEFEIVETHEHSIVVKTRHATHPHFHALLMAGNGYHDAVPADGMLKHEEDDVLTLYWCQSKAHLLDALQKVCVHCTRYPNNA